MAAAPAARVVDAVAEVASSVEPAYGVGGDGFDYWLNGDVLDLVIYDAVGHG